MLQIAQIGYYDIGGYIVYVVNEPKHTETQLFKQIYFTLKQNLDINEQTKQDFPNTCLQLLYRITSIPPDILKTIPEVKSAIYYAGRDLFGYDAITIPFLDSSVEEIQTFGNKIFVSDSAISEIIKAKVNIILTNINIHPSEYDSEQEKLEIFTNLVQTITSMSGKGLTAANPMVDGRVCHVVYPSGKYRCHRLSSYLEVPGATSGFALRKFPERTLSILHMIHYGTIDPLIAAYAAIVLMHRGTVMVIGTTGSGKTTLMQSILGIIPSKYKIYVAEDTPEIQLPSINIEYLYTRKAPEQGEIQNIDLAELIKKSLRHRPDIIVVGEIRSREVASFIQAAASGHGGATTFHATNPYEVLTRVIDLGVSPYQLLLLKSIISVAPTTIPYIDPITNRKMIKIGRRVMAVYEITNVAKLESKDPEEMKKGYDVVFSWRRNEDVFVPRLPRRLRKNSLREMMSSLWSRSRVLRGIGSYTYGGEEEGKNILYEVFGLGYFIYDLYRKSLSKHGGLIPEFATTEYVNKMVTMYYTSLKSKVEEGLRRLVDISEL